MPNQQRALPLSVFRRLYHNRFTPLDEALGQLACGAFFFGLRSCEYLAIQGTRKTKRLKLRNIRFFKQNRDLSKSSPDNLHTADTVSITFEFQKNRQKNITVTQPRSNKEICPVIIWAQVVARVLSYKGTTTNTYVNTVFIGKQRYYVKATDMFQHISVTVDSMQDTLGFDGSKVGTHSIRSSLAMALYLARRPITTIMLIGRWCSDAFLLYVRRQVQEFSTGVSADMTQNEHFFTIPDLDFSDDPTDPRTRNQQSFAHTISFNGSSNAPSRAQRPSVHVYH